MKIAAIDLDALHDVAFAEGKTAVVSRSWLRDIYLVLNGKAFADARSSADERQVRIMGAIDGMLTEGTSA